MNVVCFDFLLSCVVNGDFFCSYTNINSLHNIHKHIKFIKNQFICNDNVTHILGLFFIKGLKSVNINDEINKIINKYLPLGDLHMCQEELLDAGFIEQAKF